MSQEEALSIEELQRIATLAGISLERERLREIARRLVLLQEDLIQLRSLQLGAIPPATIFKR